MSDRGAGVGVVQVWCGVTVKGGEAEPVPPKWEYFTALKFCLVLLEMQSLAHSIMLGAADSGVEGS